MKLKEMLEQGWKETAIDYKKYKVYAKGEMRMIYDIQKESVIIKYHKGKRR